MAALPLRPLGPRSLLVAAIYPALFWIASATASLHSQLPAVLKGPREKRVVWDIPREGLPEGATTGTSVDGAERQERMGKQASS